VCVVERFGLGVSGVGFRDYGVGCMVKGLGIRVWGVGCRFQVFGVWV